LLSGNLANANKDDTATILSADADIIWAIGNDDTTSEATAAYHDNNRGYRFIDWSDPESHLPDAMKCS
jgi:hypothetical protein